MGSEIQRWSTGGRLHPVGRREATGLVARVYEQVRRDFFLAPPLALHSPSPELLAAVWCVFRETMLCGEAPRAWKEAVATAVARANRCPFCVDAHTMFLEGLGAHETARALAKAETDPAEGELAAVVSWASAVRSPAAPVLRKPPFGAHWAPELVATVVAFQYVTTVATVFLGPSPVPRGFRWMKPLVRRVGGKLLARRLARKLPPGRSLVLLDDAPAPLDLSWSAPAPALAGAFARLAATVERAAERIHPPAVRRLLGERIARWQGESPELSSSWFVLEPEVAGLRDEEKTLARLALLSAFAPERITTEFLADCLAEGAGERELAETVAWSAFSAARRVGSWVRGPF